METSNALVQSTQLGKNDHGLLTLWLNLSWEGSGAGFGGFPRTADHLGFCVERILDTVGVGTWEKLTGRYVRIEHDGTQIHRIGHLIENKWFDPDEEMPPRDRSES